MVEPLTLRTSARDNLQNVISGLGTYKDKTIATQYVFVPLGVDQLEAAYRGDWIARKVVDIPAQDSTRMWREWQAEKDEITKIEDLEREHDIQGKVNRAMTLARLYGGSALILGVDGAGTEKQELNLERVKLDSLKFVHAVHRWELGASEIDYDIKSKNYRLPLYYTVQSSLGETLDVHWTRVIRFIGCPIPDPAKAPEGWGDSILQVVDTAIKGAGIVIGGVAALVQEAKIDVIKIPNLSERLSTKEYADKLAQRMTYANVIKSMNNALLIDAAEEWQRIQTSFAALPDLLHTYLMCAAGAADIPATRLIGQSPRGLNATGESDIRNYYDKIKSEQNTVLRPALSTLDEVLIRSALGSRDEGVFYEWNSLWQMNETEQADLAKKKADTFVIDVNTGLIDSNALRIGRENQLIEDGTYPGLEQTLADQEAGEIPTQEEQFAHDPEMNPDHPQNLAAQQTAEAQAKEAQFHAKNPLAAIKAKAKPLPFGKKKKISDFNPNHDPDTGEFSSGGSSARTARRRRERESRTPHADPATEELHQQIEEKVSEPGTPRRIYEGLKNFVNDPTVRKVAAWTVTAGVAAWIAHETIRRLSTGDFQSRDWSDKLKDLYDTFFYRGPSNTELLSRADLTGADLSKLQDLRTFTNDNGIIPNILDWVKTGKNPFGDTDYLYLKRFSNWISALDGTVKRSIQEGGPPSTWWENVTYNKSLWNIPKIEPGGLAEAAGAGAIESNWKTLRGTMPRGWVPSDAAAEYRLSSSDIDVLVTKFEIERASLEALRFDPFGELIGTAAGKDSAGNGVVDDLDGGPEEALPLQQPPAPPPPVIVNLIPGASKELQGHIDTMERLVREVSLWRREGANPPTDLYRRIADAVGKALKAQSPVAHAGRVKRIVRDVEHDSEGKITRITDTEGE